MNKKIDDVFETDDFSQFKHLLGNRDVTEDRIAKIIDSIQRIGYINNPCVVNKKNEIIDGQARMVALERLGIPVHYVIDENAGLDECIQLNMNGTTWKIPDYINSYCAQGNHNYENLRDLIEMFPEIPIDVISYAVSGRVDYLKAPTSYAKKTGKKGLGRIPLGMFICDDIAKQSAYERLLYCEKFVQPVKRAKKGSATYMLKGIIFSVFYAGADADVMEKAFDRYQQKIIPYVNMQTAMVSIQTVYNYQNRRKQMNLSLAYDNYMTDFMPSYKTKWSPYKEDIKKEA